MIGSTYRAGNSALHRAAPGVKIGVLLACGLTLFLARSPVLVIGGLFACCGGVLAGRMTLRRLGGALKHIAPTVLLVGALQVCATSWVEALTVAARLLCLLLLAHLVLATTRPSDLADVLERALTGLRLFGVDPTRVSLAIALTMRFVPEFGHIALQVRQAQAARGREFSMLALGVPLILLALKAADEISEAIEARS